MTNLEALKAIAEGVIVSSDQSPGAIAESVLRVIQLVRGENCEYLLLISAQQKRAERAESQASKMLEALESIRDTAECFLQPLADHPSVSRARWEKVRDRAVAAIAAVKGENEGLED